MPRTSAADDPQEPEIQKPAKAPKAGMSISEEIDALTDPNFMTSLARGLAVIRAFSDQRRSLTIAQVSHRTGIPRAAVRRCLYTLRQLGYVDTDGNTFSLKPKVLAPGVEPHGRVWVKIIARRLCEKPPTMWPRSPLTPNRIEASSVGPHFGLE